jgi:hypothetical protein
MNTTTKTATEIRQDFNRAIDAMTANFHVDAGRKARAVEVVSQLQAHAWLRDQIPYDVLGIALTAAQAVR